MPKAGEIKVRLPMSDAALLGAWLGGIYAEQRSSDAEGAFKFAGQLDKAMRRKQVRQTFQWVLPRQKVEWFANLAKVSWFTEAEPNSPVKVIVPPEIKRISEHFKAALRGRGRPTLKGPSDLQGAIERQEAVIGRYGVDPRHRTRLRRRLRYKQAWDTFNESGKTLLGNIEELPIF